MYYSEKHFKNMQNINWMYTLKHANPDLGKNMHLLKNPQFLPNHYETLSKRRYTHVNVGKKLETKLQYFDIYLHNKNILEYA